VIPRSEGRKHPARIADHRCRRCLRLTRGRPGRTAKASSSFRACDVIAMRRRGFRPGVVKTAGKPPTLLRRRLHELVRSSVSYMSEATGQFCQPC
jgi:hypothetical protein